MPVTTRNMKHCLVRDPINPSLATVSGKCFASHHIITHKPTQNSTSKSRLAQVIDRKTMKIRNFRKFRPGTFQGLQCLCPFIGWFQIYITGLGASKWWFFWYLPAGTSRRNAFFQRWCNERWGICRWRTSISTKTAKACEDITSPHGLKGESWRGELSNEKN